MKISIWVFDGVDEIDFAGPYEILRHTGKFDVSLVTLREQKEVIGQHGLHFRPDGVLDGLLGQKTDLLVVPGGGWVNRSSRGLRHEVASGAIQKEIQRLHGQGAVIAAVCTGGMAVAEAGLLKHLPAITHAGAIEDLRPLCGKVVHARVVDAGTLLTSGGVTSSLDLALWIVERYLGKPEADRVAHYIEHERSPEIFVK